MKNHPLFCFPNFRQLFVARLISASGDKFFSIALAWWVISQNTGFEKSRLGILMAVNFIPVVIFGPFLGSVVDRLGKKQCMLMADAARALCISILIFFLLSKQLSVTLLYSLCFITAAFNPLFEAAASSSLEKLGNGNESDMQAMVATDSSVMEVSSVLGALLGSAFLAMFGVLGAFVFNALSFVLSFAFVLKIKANLSDNVISPFTYWQDLRSGFAFLKQKKDVFLLMLIFAALNFFAAPLLLFIPMIVRFILHKDVNWVAYLELFFALGAILTAIYMSLRKQNTTSTPLAFKLNLFIPIAISGCATALLALTNNPWPAAILLFCAGMCVSLVNTAALTAFQNRVPFEFKGRFFSLLNSTCFAVIPLAFLLNGFFAETISLPTIIAANGIGAVILSFLVFLL